MPPVSVSRIPQLPGQLKHKLSRSSKNYLPRTWVNKGKEKGRVARPLRLLHRFRIPRWDQLPLSLEASLLSEPS